MARQRLKRATWQHQRGRGLAGGWQGVTRGLGKRLFSLVGVALIQLSKCWLLVCGLCCSDMLNDWPFHKMPLLWAEE